MPVTARFNNTSFLTQARLFSTTDAQEVQEDLSKRYWLRDGENVISPWHDVPLRVANSDSKYNYINEISVGERAKMEVATDEQYNPIKQDVKKGKLRFFTYGDIPFNYGMLPQTYEDPDHAHPDTGYNGDKDPIDVVELSDTPLGLGMVSEIRVLGCMALIDEEETDWKILGIASSHPEYQQILTHEDIEKHLPGKIDTIRDWFMNYKTTDGKPVNSYAFDGAVKDTSYAEKIIEETHQSWKDLVAGDLPDNGLWVGTSVDTSDKA